MSDSKHPILDDYLKDRSLPLLTRVIEHLDRDIAAIEEKHAAEIAAWSESSEKMFKAIGDLSTENQQLRAKLTGMVCGTCKGKKKVEITTLEKWDFEPCPVCQPKKEGFENG